MTKYTDVPQSVIDNAYNHFRELYYPDRLGVGDYLWVFVGMPVGSSIPHHGSDMKDDQWKFPPDVAHRLTLLASPNYATIAKMMELEGHPTNVSIFGGQKGEILRGDELYPTS